VVVVHVVDLHPIAQHRTFDIRCEVDSQHLLIKTTCREATTWLLVGAQQTLTKLLYRRSAYAGMLIPVVARKEQDQPAFDLIEGHASIAFCVVFTFLIGPREGRTFDALESLGNCSHQALNVRAVPRLLYRPKVDIDVVLTARHLEHVAPKLFGVVHVDGAHDPQHGQVMSTGMPRRLSSFSLGRMA